MTKAFNDFMDSWKASLGVSCGHGAQRDAATGFEHAPIETAAGSDGRLDALGGRVHAAQSDWSPEFSYICADCGETFLSSDVLQVCHLCADPGILCPECYDAHMEAGHVTDAMNAASGKG